VSVKGARARACADRRPPPPPADCARVCDKHSDNHLKLRSASYRTRNAPCICDLHANINSISRGERASICRRARGRGQRNAACATHVAVARRRAHDQHVHTPLCTCGTVVSQTRCWTYKCARNCAAGSPAARLDVVSPAREIQQLATLRRRDEVAATHPVYAERGRMTRMRTIYRIYCVCCPLRRFHPRRKWLLSDSITPAHFPK
jgi:hypothetical protein